MKRDIKYIIKRIIIGVGIAVILGIIKTNNVFAEEPNNLYLNYFGFNLKEISTSPWGDESNIVYNFNYSNYNFNINYIASNFYYLLFKDNENYYIISSNTFSCNSSNLNNFSGNITFSSTNITYNNDDISCSSNDPYFFELQTLSVNNLDSSFTNEILNNLDSASYYNDYYNNEFYYNIFVGNYTYNSPGTGSLYAYNLLNYFYNNYELVSTSSNINFYLDDELLIPNGAPIGYTEINLQNKHGVYFVPKNYSTIPTELVSSIKFIKFPFYYKGNIKTGYFDLKNNNKIVFDFNLTYSSSEFEFVDTSFPMYYEENGTFSEDPNGYIIYNNVISDSSIVRYNSNLFNAYVIEDMNNYSGNISFINENGESESLSISFNKSLQEIWEDGIANGGEHFSDFASKSNLYKFFDIIKFPFTYIKSLNNTTCIPLSFELPFINYNLSLPCLSSIFQNYFGRYYDLIKILISGIVLYNVFLVNFYTVIEVLRPQSSQIEVIDL